MKLSELLDLPVFKGTIIRAGEKNIDYEVNTVNMMDAPDIIHFLKKDELLITTAFHFKDDLHSLITLIEEMKKKGCSGLGIKTKRFLQEIPLQAIELAQQLNFPLLELPMHTSLGDIVHKSLNYILDIRTTELRNAMMTHQQFTNQIMNGQNVHKILQSLSSLIHFQVVLLNHHLQPITNSSHDYSIYEKLETILVENDIFQQTPFTFSLLSPDKITLTLFPVHTHKQYSYLCVFGEIHPTDRSTVLTIEQAINVIAFELMKENALKQNERRLHNEFFNNFINGSFTTSQEILSRGKEFGLENEQRYVCAVGKTIERHKETSFSQHRQDYELIYDTIEAELQRFSQTVHFFTVNRAYVLLFPLKSKQVQMDQFILDLLRKLQVKVSSRFKKDLCFGLSNYAQQLLHVPISYKEANDTLYYGQLSGQEGFIETYQPKEVPEILRMVPYEQLKKFYSDTFQPFFDGAKKDHDVLLHTLSVYLETHCQLSETAKRLYVHRNTVIYRLEKCEELIGRSLKEPDETLRLRLAFRIKALIQGQGESIHV
ncbi:PucR family transcriptional regulator [Priestia filamentosa]|uniref:PucR family transcriptional regulator n=1 Tax=Priestia filamentosa TaxID=1402861 RepID=UPI003978C023